MTNITYLFNTLTDISYDSNPNILIILTSDVTNLLANETTKSYYVGFTLTMFRKKIDASSAK